ncbi:MAG: hypothetical protein KDE19_00440 [Caldilineaceae bacterium]|nr:hypothetical protein [Caldilineaceae bacterium]
MGKQHSYEEIAKDYELWGEYVDPQATMTESEFDEMPDGEKVKMQEDMFGKEETTENN